MTFASANKQIFMYKISKTDRASSLHRYRIAIASSSHFHCIGITSKTHQHRVGTASRRRRIISHENEGKDDKSARLVTMQSGADRLEQ